MELNLEGDADALLLTKKNRQSVKEVGDEMRGGGEEWGYRKYTWSISFALHGIRNGYSIHIREYYTMQVECNDIESCKGEQKLNEGMVTRP